MRAVLGEFEVIEHYFAPLAKTQAAFALRDDAAVITPPEGEDLVITKDMLCAGIHFFDNDPPDLIARKALRVNLSDLIAKGAKPLGYLLGIGLDGTLDACWLEKFANGLACDQRDFGLTLWGGDTIKAGERVTISITMIGTVPSKSSVLRSGASEGDILYVTGTIGDSTLGLLLRLEEGLDHDAVLSREARAHLKKRYLLPEPRLDIIEPLRSFASASMDISDGLAGDLDKLSRASDVSAYVEWKRIPISEAAQEVLRMRPNLQSRLFSGGDDYEVLMTIPDEKTAAFEEACAKINVPIKAIGTMKKGYTAPKFIGPRGNSLQFNELSFVHF